MLKLITKSSVTNKIILLRLDLNVPVYQNKILSDFRIIKSIPTIKYLLDTNNKVIILSHFGRPKEGQKDPSLSLKNISAHLSKILDKKIVFIDDWINGVDFLDSDIVMCENVRFQIGERDNSLTLSEKISLLGDIYVFDAFGVSHRKESSTYGVSNYLDSYAGLLLEDEVKNAQKLLTHTKPPLVTIISGAKISTKLSLIKKLINKSENIIIGGGILNTFLSAMGFNIGSSLIEKNFISEAKEIINSEYFNKIIMPIDVVTSNNIDFLYPKTKEISMVQSKDKILDIGMQTINRYIEVINKSKSVFWNGPLGYVEKKPYDNGTIKLSQAIARSDTYSIIGGGDTIPIIESLGIQNDFSCLSTGGGSLLKFIEGKDLPILSKLGVYSK